MVWPRFEIAAHLPFGADQADACRALPLHKTNEMIDHIDSIKADFEAQVTAALMIQSNALIPIKLAAKLCGISRQEIYRRIQNGTFPKPKRLSSRKNSMRKAFHLQDIHDWIRNPTSYRWSEN